MNAIRALFLRDARIDLSYNFALALRAVAIGVGSLSLLFLDRIVDAPDALAPYGGDYFAFALLGLALVRAVQPALTGPKDAITGAQADGTLEALLVRPVRLEVLLAGSVVYPLAFAIAEATFTLAVGVALGARYTPAGLPVALLATALFVLAQAGIGALAAAFVLLTKRGDPVVWLVGQATSVLCGVVFPVSVMPGVLQALAKVFPAYHALEVARRSLAGTASIADIARGLGALAGLALVLPLGLALVRRSLDVARRAGTLASA